MTGLNKAIDKQTQQRIKTLIYNHRWAALATLGENGPEVSWVAYVAELEGLLGFILNISQLAAHTHNLLQDPWASLGVSETEKAGYDPQQLARLMVDGQVAVIPKTAPDYPIAAQHYQSVLPMSKRLFEFSDFMLMRFRPLRVRFVGGFAQSYNLSPAALQTMLLEK
jgi:putative heme iron utilization protein